MARVTPHSKTHTHLLDSISAIRSGDYRTLGREPGDLKPRVRSRSQLCVCPSRHRALCTLRAQSRSPK
eukprot:714305-Prymnesium_polylepis.1